MTMLLPSKGVSQRSPSDQRSHLWIPATSCCAILFLTSFYWWWTLHFFLPLDFNRLWLTNYGTRCFPKIPLTDDVTSTSSSSRLLSDQDPRSTKHIGSSSTSSIISSPSTTCLFLTTWSQNIWSTIPFICGKQICQSFTVPVSYGKWVSISTG